VIPDVTKELTEIGWGAAVVLLIYGLSQLLSTELSATPTMPDFQRKMFRIMPLVIVIFVWQFPVPAGLVLYWMTTNVWTAGQQLVMRHKIGLHLSQTPLPDPTAKRGSRTPPKAATAAAPEPRDAPEAREAPEPREAAEEGAARDDGGERAATAPPRPAGGRRQPRPKGAGRPARPAGRRPAKKKR